MIIVSTLRKMKATDEKVSMLVAYESNLVVLVDKAGVDVLLMGDSLGVTMRGRKSMLPVNLHGMCYHIENVAYDTENAVIIADLPSGTYQQNKEQAFATSAELMVTGAHMVGLEDSVWMVGTTEFPQMRGIPVCAHIGLTPQSVFASGGYRMQGCDDRTEASLRDAEAHDTARAAIILMECAPMALVKWVTEAVSCPAIGIGTDVDYDGQVLVMRDILGVLPGKTAKFARSFMAGRNSIQGAVEAYTAGVKARAFPTAERIFEE